MNTYVVTQDGPVFEVRLGDASGRVVATFSNRLAAEKFAEQQQARDDTARNHPTNGCVALTAWPVFPEQFSPHDL
jgi:hypothetical protein